MTVLSEPSIVATTRSRTVRWRVSIAANVADASDAWDALDAAGGGSGYQRRRFLEPWIAQIAPMRRMSPALGIITDARRRTVALLPFGVSRLGPLRLAQFLGGRDSNLNLPLVDPAISLTPDDARDILQAYATALAPRIDLMVLSNQPRIWRGRPNPFAFEAASPSPSHAYGAMLGSDVSAFLDVRTSRATAKKLRLKTAHLARLGALDFSRAEPEDAPQIVASFIAQKQQGLARRGVDAGLDHDSVRSFLTALATSPQDSPVLDLYVLQVERRVAAVFGGIRDADHWHGLINSYDAAPELARCSPGELLLRHAIADLGRRGIASFDLGIGEARYKSALCDHTIELVDALVPLTGAGRLFATGEMVRLVAKGAIKRRPWALSAVQHAQSWLRPRP